MSSLLWGSGNTPLIHRYHWSKLLKTTCFSLTFSPSLVQRPRSGSPTPITTSSTVQLPAQRWGSWILLSPPPLLVEVCLITMLPGQIKGWDVLLTSKSRRQQTGTTTHSQWWGQLRSDVWDFTGTGRVESSLFYPHRCKTFSRSRTWYERDTKTGCRREVESPRLLLVCVEIHLLFYIQMK